MNPSIFTWAELLLLFTSFNKPHPSPAIGHPTLGDHLHEPCSLQSTTDAGDSPGDRSGSTGSLEGNVQ